ncbi:MAG: hypothetical protein HOE80_04265 [Candidatus Magasanikbacteria bacterium]|jgi:hypothetical protein|nr:hypothetical protein [Candidatus Magasanikbacteria bacterium]MBT4071908.1 hypothetical protein [Candidatus Magasanikbacteria bacterium]
MDTPSHTTQRKQFGKKQTSVKTYRLLELLSIGFFMGLIFLFGFFIYSSVFQSLEQINAIVILKSDLNIDTIDFTLLGEAQEDWNKKYNNEAPTLSRNPFVLPNIETSIPTTTLSILEQIVPPPQTEDLSAVRSEL